MLAEPPPSPLCSIRTLIGPSSSGLLKRLADAESAAADLTEDWRGRGMIRIKVAAAGLSSPSSGSAKP